MKHKPSIIFMGTPDFAVPALAALADFGCRIPLVVTRPDRPKGRGRKLTSPPVKKAAENLGLQILQPEATKSDAFYQAIAEHHPDILVVVAFGHILPKRVLEIPPYGAINVHASLLPKYRGPAPIQWAVINGEKKTGVTTMLMDAGLDTGEILMASETPIHPDDTAGTLHDRLAQAGGALLKQTIAALQAGTLQPVPQNHGEASYAPMLKKADGRIDWSQPAEHIERQIRGMNPWPLAHCFYEDLRLNIFKAEVRPATRAAVPGTVIPGFSKELRIAAGQEALSLLELQAAGGKRLPVGDFLSGMHIPEGAVLK
ncbi:MAG: methionyl-tRNA formyltransferase [Desulfobacterales bacterium]|nr:methionyl-tRNA formyltransferase [Desulfobacterales bacterium]